MSFHDALEQFLQTNHPQKSLENLLSPSEIKELKLPKEAHPKPIFHLPNNPLPSLKKSYIDTALLSLYKNIPLPKNTHIILLTYVIEGYGDYYAQLEIASILQKAFPEITLDFILFLHKDRKIKHPHKHHLLSYTGKESHKIVYEFPSKKTLNSLRSASIIIETPTKFPHLKDLSPLPTIESLGECGMIHTQDFGPESGSRSLGFHCLEKGVFSKKIPKITSFTQIGTQEIACWMKEQSPLLKEYKQKTSFNLAYTKSKKGQEEYLSILLQGLAKDTRSIDLLLFSLPDLTSKRILNTCKLFGVKKIILYYASYQSTLPLCKNGKTLRIFVTKHIDHNDFLKFMDLTDTLIGCTGDGSLFEAISAEKPFYYDTLSHKKSALTYLTSLATGAAAAFLNGNFLEKGALLQKSQIKQDFQKLGRLIKEHYSVNALIPWIVKRALLHKKSPEIRAFENKQMELFINGSISVYKALLNIQNLLNQGF